LGVDLLERLVPARDNVLAVLTYHRIAERSEVPAGPAGLISTTPEELEQQVALVARRYRPIGIDDLIRIMQAPGARLPPRSVLITFDDAYPDFAEHAWPILDRHRVPATLFVPTSYPGSADAMFWWDRLHRVVTHDPDAHLILGTARLPLASRPEQDRAYGYLHGYLSNLAPSAMEPALLSLESQVPSLPPKKRSTLTWDELRRLAAAGVTLAPHSRTHPRLDLLDPADLAAEVAGSLDELRSQVGSCSPAFAYPGGYVSPTVAGAVRDAGYALAFTTARGLNDVRSMDPSMVRRLNVGSRSSPALIRAQMLPIRMPRLP